MSVLLLAAQYLALVAKVSFLLIILHTVQHVAAMCNHVQFQMPPTDSPTPKYMAHILTVFARCRVRGRRYHPFHHACAFIVCSTSVIGRCISGEPVSVFHDLHPRLWQAPRISSLSRSFVPAERFVLKKISRADSDDSTHMVEIERGARLNSFWCAPLSGKIQYKCRIQRCSMSPR